LAKARFWEKLQDTLRKACPIISAFAGTTIKWDRNGRGRRGFFDYKKIRVISLKYFLPFPLI